MTGLAIAGSSYLIEMGGESPICLLGDYVSWAKR